MLVAGNYDEFTMSIARSLDCEHTYALPRDSPFKDGELKPTLLQINTLKEDQDIVFVYRKKVTQDPQAYLLDFVFTAKKIKEQNKNNRVIGVMPYLVFSRQYKTYFDGDYTLFSNLGLEVKEVSDYATLKHVIELLEESLDGLVTISPHHSRGEGHVEMFSSDFPAFSIDGFNILKRSLEKYYPDKLVLISPDEGGKEIVKEMAVDLDCSWDYLIKHRDTTTNEISFEDKDLDVKGRKVVIIDDIMDTGGTIFHAYEDVKKREPSMITLSFVHGVFSNGSFKKLDEEIIKKGYPDTIAYTNTIINDSLGEVDTRFITNVTPSIVKMIKKKF